MGNQVAREVQQARLHQAARVVTPDLSQRLGWIRKALDPVASARPAQVAVRVDYARMSVAPPPSITSAPAGSASSVGPSHWIRPSCTTTAMPSCSCADEPSASARSRMSKRCATPPIVGPPSPHVGASHASDVRNSAKMWLVGWEPLRRWGEDVARIEPLAGGVANDVWSVHVNGHLAVGRLEPGATLISRGRPSSSDTSTVKV
jgi:hypothetical protein